MSTWRHPPLAVAGLVAVGVIDMLLLADLIAWWATGSATTRAAEWKPNISAHEEGAPAIRLVSDYTQILAHPLFFKTREPFVPPPPPSPRPPKAPTLATPVIDPGLSVVGIVINGTMRQACLLSNSDHDGTWVREGDEYAGWRLQAVTAAAAKLQRDAKSIELRLYPKQ